MEKLPLHGEIRPEFHSIMFSIHTTFSSFVLQCVSICFLPLSHRPDRYVENPRQTHHIPHSHPVLKVEGSNPTKQCTVFPSPHRPRLIPGQKGQGKFPPVASRVRFSHVDGHNATMILLPFRRGGCALAVVRASTEFHKTVHFVLRTRVEFVYSISHSSQVVA